jgi:ABC-type lipopolysaccharide export system ATPase subunit
MQKLIVDEIGKAYKGRQVVRGVSLEISQGEVVGLLGPNGAGKTTSFYMIVGLIAPDSGHLTRAHVHAGPPVWHQLPAAGAERLSQTDG